MKRRGTGLLGDILRQADPVLLVLCGCQLFLPAGEPPAGRITDNTPDTAITGEELKNNAVTLLTAFLLTHPEIRSVSAACVTAEAVLKEASSVSGAAVQKRAVYTLKYDNMVYKLYDKDKRLLWQYPETK